MILEMFQKCPGPISIVLRPMSQVKLNKTSRRQQTFSRPPIPNFDPVANILPNTVRLTGRSFCNAALCSGKVWDPATRRPYGRLSPVPMVNCIVVVSTWCHTEIGIGGICHVMCVCMCFVGWDFGQPKQQDKLFPGYHGSEAILQLSM